MKEVIDKLYSMDLRGAKITSMLKYGDNWKVTLEGELINWEDCLDLVRNIIMCTGGDIKSFGRIPTIFSIDESDMWKLELIYENY